MQCLLRVFARLHVLACRRCLFAGFFIITGVLNFSPAAAMTGLAPMAENAADGVLVKFQAGISSRRIQRALRAAGCSQNRAFKTSLLRGLVQAHITAGNSMQRTLNSLRRNRFVEFAEPNYLWRIQALPNDGRFPSLWGLNNTGQTGGLPNADIDAPEAWDISVGSADVIIAVVDTGLDYTHPEMLGNAWVNPREIPGNGVDDDNNGYIDDVRGWDFANNDNDPLDDNNHGTHVSGTIAAAGNNGVGVAGVNWTAQIMPLKFLDATGAGSTAGAIAAINYAVANGARVINASWGGGPFSVALFNAISAANNAGVLFVTAAGNAGRDTDLTPSYPGSYNLSNILSVAATDDADLLAGFSNFGATSVDLGAPGVGILSTLAGGGYGSFNGTSMAAPHVSGVAGLLLAVNPNLTVAQLKGAILAGVDPVPALTGRTLSGGRLNAFAALLGVAPPPPPPATVSVLPASASLNVGDTLQLSASGGTAPYAWSVSNPAVASIAGGGLLTALGVGSVVVSATDANGVRGSSGVISVTAVPPLSVTPGTATLSVGQALTFNASGGFTPYSWRSSNPAVASIDAITGRLTALAAGVTTVRVTDNTGASASSGSITVTTIGLSPTSATLAPGDTVLFSATGGVAPYVWSSSNPAVAGINPTTGLLSASAPGVTVVRVSDALGNTAVSGNVTVLGLSLNPVSAVLTVGDSLAFTVSGGTAPYVWRSSNPAVASISTNGVLTALAAGTVSVEVVDANGVSARSGTISVNAQVLPLALTPTTAALTVGDSLQFSASGGVPPYAWRSSNGTVASIDSRGLVTALASGSFFVTLSDAAGATVSSAFINVSAPPAVLTISPDVATLTVGESQQFTALGAVDFVSWSSSDPTLASISNFGVLTALREGTVTVSAVSGGMGGMGGTVTGTSGNITILPAPPVVTITPSTGSVAVGGTLQFSASGATPPYLWRVDDPTVASVDPNGLLTGLGVGSVVVSAVDRAGVVGSSGVINVFDGRMHRMQLTPNSGTLVSSSRNRSLQFTVSGAFPPFKFSSTNSRLGWIDPNTGLFTAYWNATGSFRVIVTDALDNSIFSEILYVVH